MSSLGLRPTSHLGSLEPPEKPLPAFSHRPHCTRASEATATKTKEALSALNATFRDCCPATHRHGAGGAPASCSERNRVWSPCWELGGRQGGLELSIQRFPIEMAPRLCRWALLVAGFRRCGRGPGKQKRGANGSLLWRHSGLPAFHEPTPPQSPP